MAYEAVLKGGASAFRRPEIGDGERLLWRDAARHRAPRTLRVQSRARVIQTAVSIKSWTARPPSVEQVRPSRCSGCGAASRPVGGRLVVHGQGLLSRQVRGVVDVDAAPGVVVIAVRRYECQHCRAVMTVVPAGMLARRLYSAPSIALALHLWLTMGHSDREVRRCVCAWRLRGPSSRGWAQLYRWARAAGSLFFLTSTMTVERVLVSLRALAPVGVHGSPLAQQVFEGACHTR